MDGLAQDLEKSAQVGTSFMHGRPEGLSCERCDMSGRQTCWKTILPCILQKLTQRAIKERNPAHEQANFPLFCCHASVCYLLCHAVQVHALCLFLVKKIVHCAPCMFMWPSKDKQDRSACLSFQVQEVDEPDLALRLAEGLRERPEAEITTQVGVSMKLHAETRYDNCHESQLEGWLFA